MQRRRKSKWEFAVIGIAVSFFLVCVASAGWASPKPRNVEAPVTPMVMQTAGLETRPELPTATRPAIQETDTTPAADNSLIGSRDWGAEDAEILLRIAMAEAEGEDTEGKALVMLVVLNRAWSDGFPDSIEDVVFQKSSGVYQFSPVMPGGRYWTKEPDEDCMAALRMIENGWDESNGALYFEACSGSSWQSENCEFLFRHGNHNFYK